MRQRFLSYFLVLTNLIFLGAVGCTSSGGTGNGTTSIVSVEISATKDHLIPGEALQLDVVARDANGNVVAGTVITFHSDFPEFAEVDAAGLVNALYPGDVQITASSGGISSSPLMLVIDPPDNSMTVNQLTDNTDSDDWGMNNSWKMTSQGRVLWQRVDGGGDTHVLLHNVADAVGDDTTITTVPFLTGDVDFMAFGSGAIPGTVMASWRVNLSDTFVSDDGASPLDLMMQDQEENSIAEGCLFFREGNAAHDIERFSFAAGLDEVASMGELRGPVGSQCEAVWELVQVGSSDLIFFDGSTLTPVATGLSVFPRYDLRDGQIVYAKDGDIFLLDTTTSPITTSQLTTDGMAVIDQNPKTDGISVVWHRIDGADEHIVLFNRVTGAEEILSDNAGIKVGSTLQIDLKQVLWRECDASPCSNGNAHLYFNDGDGTSAGTDEIPLGGVPTDVGFAPYLDSGVVSWVGNDGDTEVFVMD